MPVYGLSEKGRVIELITLTARGWDAARIKRVTGLISDGWDGWYPAQPEDRERVLAAREALKKTRANAPGPHRREQPDLPGVGPDR
jgi:hypothetical protein